MSGNKPALPSGIWVTIATSLICAKPSKRIWRIQISTLSGLRNIYPLYYAILFAFDH
jgi:hypothetical protein